jgi:hypothetical protein
VGEVIKKTFFYGGGVLLLILISVVIFWKTRQAYYEPKIRDAKRFCEMLIPKVEAERTKSGKYPETIDASWFDPKQVPELIRLNGFYEGGGNVYRFYFFYPGDFWDNIWGYQCGVQQACDWVSYDANP